jgi:hypothetical protein
MANQMGVQQGREAETAFPPRQRPANPLTAPGILFLRLWRRGGKARTASAAYLCALILGLGLGVILGMATDPHWTHTDPYRWTAMGLAIACVSLIVLGGVLLYLATKDDPKDPSVQGAWVRPRLSYLRSPTEVSEITTPAGHSTEAAEKSTQVYEGTNQIQRVVIAKKLLG